MSRSLMRRTSLLLVASALIVTACGDDDSDAETEAPEATDATDATGAPTDETSAGTADESGDSGEQVTLKMFTGNVEAGVQTAEGLIAAFEAANPDIKIELDSSGPQGTELDNLVKTKLGHR